MYCPRCRTEYEAGVSRCPDCDVELVGELSAAAGGDAEWVDLVTVLESGDHSLLLVAKSLLDAEHIPCVGEGEGVWEGLGAGRVAGADVPMGPGRLRVHPEDADNARALLAHLQPLKESEEAAS